MHGHSLQRDGLSPIPTDHRDGLGNAPRPPLRLGPELLKAGMGTTAVHSGPCGSLASIAGQRSPDMASSSQMTQDGGRGW